MRTLSIVNLTPPPQKDFWRVSWLSPGTPYRLREDGRCIAFVSGDTEEERYRAACELTGFEVLEGFKSEVRFAPESMR